jgi:uncharacterized membrane protein
MVFFHLSFDLDYFNFISIDILHHPLWYFLPRLIVFLFFFAVGMSLKIAHQDQIHWKSFGKRQFKLIMFALLISVVTRFLFPENWIYFGTLHCIALISFIGLYFIHRENLALIIALALFIPSIIWNYNIPFFELPIQSFDYISPFPWLGALLIGIYATKMQLHLVKINSNRIIGSLQHLGKHSLIIYLLHQPILFGLIFFVSKIKH